MQMLIWARFCRLTRYPICFRTFLRKFSLLNLCGNGRPHPGYFRDNIRYDLLRTGSVRRTTDKILERSFLDAVRIHIKSVSHPGSDIDKWNKATTCILYALPPNNQCSSHCCRTCRCTSGAFNKETNRITHITISTGRTSSQDRTYNRRTNRR